MATVFGFAVGLIVLYFWLKGNWFVPVVLLGIACIVVGNNLSWPIFLGMGAFFYAPIVVRFLVGAFVAEFRADMGERKLGRYMLDSVISLSELSPAEQHRRDAKAKWKAEKAMRKQQKLLAAPVIEPRLPGSSAAQ